MGGFGQIMKGILNWQPSGSPEWMNKQSAEHQQMMDDMLAQKQQDEEIQHAMASGARYVGPGGLIQEQMQGPDGKPVTIHRQPDESEFVTKYPGRKGAPPIQMAWPSLEQQVRTQVQAGVPARAATVEQAGATAKATGLGSAAAQEESAGPLAKAQTKANLAARQQAIISGAGVDPPAELAALGYKPGDKVLRTEIPALLEAAAKIREMNRGKLGPGEKMLDFAPQPDGAAPAGEGSAPAPVSGGTPPAGTGASAAQAATPGPAIAPQGAAPATSAQPATAPGSPRVIASGGPPLPSDDFGKYFLPQRAKKLYGSNGTVDQMTPQQTEDAFKDFATDKKDPTQLALLHQITQAHLDQLKAQQSNEPIDIKPNTPMFKVAQDLAYGKLTMQQFRSIYSYSRNPNQKLSIYQKASELNPEFNPAGFEMGFKFASQPKVQQQLASLDNVMQAVPDLIKASDGAARSGITALNRVIIPGGVMIGGQKYSNLKTAQIAFADELSGALGYGSATDMSREMGMKMTDPALSPENFRSAVQDVVVPFINRKRSTMLKQMGPYGMPGVNPAADAAAKEQGGGIPNPGETFNGHKVLKVERVQ